jgi:hypothetical protein
MEWLDPTPKSGNGPVGASARIEAQQPVGNWDDRGVASTAASSSRRFKCSLVTRDRFVMI